MEIEKLDQDTEKFLSHRIREADLNRLKEKCEQKDPLSLFKLGILEFTGKEVQENQKHGLALINEAADLGSPPAKFFLARRFLGGKGVKVDVKKGLDYLEGAAEGNLFEASLLFADVLYEGKLCEQNKKRAARFYQQAAKWGDHKAEYLFAKLTEEEIENPNYFQIYTCYSKAARAGIAEAKIGAARMLRYGKPNVRQNPEQAFAYYKDAAQEGIPEAMLGYGEMLFRGEAGEENKEEGLKWIVKAEEADYLPAFMICGKLLSQPDCNDDELKQAAEAFQKAVNAGNSEAKYLLGKMKIKGRGIPKTVTGGMTLIKEASKEGYVPAIHSMGVAYRESKNGVKKNLKRSLECFTKAAEQNYTPSIYELGYMYEKGIGCKVDMDKAIEFYKKASEAGHGKAQFNLALIYHEGERKYRNIEEAIRLYKLACDNEVPDAYYNLGLMYYRGKYIEKDREKARVLIEKAADGGVANAQFWAFELDFEHNRDKAIQYLTNSANNGNGKACYILGTYYYDGKFVEKDPKKAAEYLAKATTLVYA